MLPWDVGSRGGVRVGEDGVIANVKRRCDGGGPPPSVVMVEEGVDSFSPDRSVFRP